MSSAVEIYERLSDFCNKQARYQERDRFLVLAMDASQSEGDIAGAELFRKKLMSLNPNHLLKPYASVQDAMRSSDLMAYIHQLRREYPAHDQEALIRKLSGDQPRSHTPSPIRFNDPSGPPSAKIRRGVGFSAGEGLPVSPTGAPTMVANNFSGPPSMSGPRSGVGISSMLGAATTVQKSPLSPPPLNKPVSPGYAAPTAKVAPQPLTPVFEPLPDPFEAPPTPYAPAAKLQQRRQDVPKLPAKGTNQFGTAPLPKKPVAQVTPAATASTARNSHENHALNIFLFGITLVGSLLGFAFVLGRPFLK